MPYEAELQAALTAAREAAKLVLADYASFAAIPDAPADISTDTDKRSQELILHSVLKRFSGDAVLAEETTPIFAQVPQFGSRLWIIDPIDGTRGFARKNGEFAVMIGWVDRGRVAVGVVIEPAHGRLTYATRGGGCWREDAGDHAPERCLVTARTTLAGSTVIQSHPRNPSKRSWQLEMLQPGRVIETYSAGIKLAQVARSEADIYLNIYDQCHEWDICAGQILVEEAGGRVTGLHGESPQYGVPGAEKIKGMLASNGHLHEAALAALMAGEHA
jgi:3'(2'), 5'-bisphosphate nucleotidase